MTFAHDERLALCDDALRVGPEAPTLDEGWTVADLVAHCYIRENDPVAALGITVPTLAPLTSRHMDAALRRHGFEGLAEAVRNGPGRWSPLRLPGVDALVNGTEMFIHHEDIRRGSGEVTPRDLGRAAEDGLWRGLGIALLTLHKAPVGVVLERADSGASRRVKAGTRTVTLVGKPSELTLWVSGRRQAADVRLVGEPDAVATLTAFTTSM
ncbi:MAG: TIGR03085 family metal-binding protein [Propionibacteriaceae bacterium]